MDPGGFHALKLDDTVSTINPAHNWLKISLAWLLIQPFHYVSRLRQACLGKNNSMRHHYYVMKMFQALAREYNVDCSIPNRLCPRQNLLFHLDLCQNTQQWIFRSRGFYELDWIRLIANMMKWADCFVDIGAHVGTFSLTVGQAEPKKKVIAIEALKNNFDLLVCNIKTNQLKNIETIWGAVADETGTKRFYANPLNDGGGSLIPLQAYQTGGVVMNASRYQKNHPSFVGYQDVPAYRLDAFITQKSIVKIDVEGSEIEVLKSGEGAFDKKQIDMVILEVGPEATPDVLQWFQKKEFECFTLGSRQPIRMDGDWGSRVGYGGRMLICLRRDSKIYKEAQWN